MTEVAPARRTVADEVASWITQVAAGVAYLVAGAQIDPLVRACVAGGVRLVPLATEAGAAAAADAHARLTRGPGVCLTIAGPGFGNCVTTAAAAAADGSGLVVLTGDVPRPMAGRGGFQDAGSRAAGDAVIARAAFGASVPVASPARIGDALATATRRALAGRPTHCSLPFDVQLAPTPGQSTDTTAEEHLRPGDRRRGAIGAAGGVVAAELATAANPVVLVADRLGTAGTTAVGRLRRRGVRIATTVDAKCVVDETFGGVDVVDPAGDPVRSSRLLTPTTDLLLVLGGRVDERTLGAPPAAVARRVRLEHVVVEVPSGCACPRGRCTRVGDLDEWVVGVASSSDPRPGTGSGSGRPTSASPADVAVAALADRADPRTVVVVDAGDARSVVARSWRARTAPGVLSATATGPMGWSLGAVVGAAVATERPVLAVLGDGSLLSAAGELAAVARHAPDARLLVLDNGGYGSVRRRLPDAAASVTDLPDEVDLVRLARAAGLRAVGIDDPAEVAVLVGGSDEPQVVVLRDVPVPSNGDGALATWRGTPLSGLGR